MRFSNFRNYHELVASKERIDIWLTNYQEITEARLLSSLRKLLSDDERARETRFHFTDDRLRYLVTRSMVRTVLSRYVPVAPAKWIFSANAYGRPVIANRDKDATSLRFNISHTRGLIALAISRDRDLGVDVEDFRNRHVSLDGANKYFSPMELAELAAIPAEQRQVRFFEYWTFKESYVKARGMGFALPLDRFGFHFPHEHGVKIVVDQELDIDGNRWSFWQFQPTREHLLSVCAERLGNEGPALTIRKTIPTIEDEMIDMPLLKSTEILSRY